jgi:hypothetical protein
LGPEESLMSPVTSPDTVMPFPDDDAPLLFNPVSADTGVTLLASELLPSPLVGARVGVEVVSKLLLPSLTLEIPELAELPTPEL